jgi:hypothetical protein
MKRLILLAALLIFPLAGTVDVTAQAKLTRVDFSYGDNVYSLVKEEPLNACVISRDESIYKNAHTTLRIFGRVDNEDVFTVLGDFVPQDASDFAEVPLGACVGMAITNA